MDEPLSVMVTRAPHPRLRPFVSAYTGYRMAGFEPGIHAGLPSGTLTMIVAFDDPLDTQLRSDGRDRQTYWAMVAGLHGRPAIVHHPGRQHGVQLAITPRGANALFGLPPAALASAVADLDQVAARVAPELVDRLSCASTWGHRWAILDEVFLRIVRFDREIPAPLERAWARLAASHGSESVASLAEAAGWSRRHFTKSFGETYGLAPKLMGRVLRFERAQQMLRLPTRPSIASVAAACGYADQAHLTRDWNEFAGSPPTTWLADESIPFVQDDPDEPDQHLHIDHIDPIETNQLQRGAPQ